MKKICQHCGSEYVCGCGGPCKICPYCSAKFFNNAKKIFDTIKKGNKKKWWQFWK